MANVQRRSNQYVELRRLSSNNRQGAQKSTGQPPLYLYNDDDGTFSAITSEYVKASTFKRWMFTLVCLLILVLAMVAGLLVGYHYFVILHPGMIGLKNVFNTTNATNNNSDAVLLLRDELRRINEAKANDGEAIQLLKGELKEISDNFLAMFETRANAVSNNSEAVLLLRDELKRINEAKANDSEAIQLLRDELKRINQAKANDSEAIQREEMKGAKQLATAPKEQLEIEEACSNAWVLDTESRGVEVRSGDRCDNKVPRQSSDWHGPGWYRFSNGRMATKEEFNSEYRCGGISPVGLNDDVHPEIGISQNVSATVCGYWHKGFCFGSKQIYIARCFNNDLIYWLPNYDWCGRYCAVKNES